MEPRENLFFYHREVSRNPGANGPMDDMDGIPMETLHELPIRSPPNHHLPVQSP